jgi:hypothetical protein
MVKPIVFLSHSSIDEIPLRTLKDILVKKTGGAIDLFLSSDGESIPLGRNWVHEIEQALDKSKLMFVFVSPSSIRSSWIHFESGYAYSKGISVVPIGILGIDLGQIAPPLSLLQGFNITSVSGLNNLIAIINKSFEHSHDEAFTLEEFDSIFAVSTSNKNLSIMKRFAGAINNIQIISNDRGDTELEMLAQFLEGQGVEYNKWTKTITTYGVTAAIKQNYVDRKHYLEIIISNELAKVTLPIISEFMINTLSASEEILLIEIEFVNTVSLFQGYHNITARLYGTEISLGIDETLQYKDITFKLDRKTWFSNEGVVQGNAYLRIDCKVGHLNSLDLEGLLEILFAQGVLWIEGDA